MATFQLHQIISLLLVGVTGASISIYFSLKISGQVYWLKKVDKALLNYEKRYKKK